MVTKLNQILAGKTPITQTVEQEPSQVKNQNTSSQHIGELLASGNVEHESGHEVKQEFLSYNGGKYDTCKRGDVTLAEDWDKDSGWRTEKGEKLSYARMYYGIARTIAPNKGIDKNSTWNDVTNALIEASIENIIVTGEVRLPIMSDDDVKICRTRINTRIEQYLAEKNYSSVEEARAKLKEEGVRTGPCFPFAALDFK
jgi:hypothetical protein